MSNPFLRRLLLALCVAVPAAPALLQPALAQAPAVTRLGSTADAPGPVRLADLPAALAATQGAAATPAAPAQPAAEQTPLPPGAPSAPVAAQPLAERELTPFEQLATLANGGRPVLRLGTEARPAPTASAPTQRVPPEYLLQSGDEMLTGAARTAPGSRRA